MDFVATQAKIQLEAQESNEALKSFGTWLNEINEKDATLNSAKIRRRGVASQTLSSSNDNSSVTVDQVCAPFMGLRSLERVLSRLI